MRPLIFFPRRREVALQEQCGRGEPGAVGTAAERLGAARMIERRISITLRELRLNGGEFRRPPILDREEER
jgi:hypothetical protein